MRAWSSGVGVPGLMTISGSMMTGRCEGREWVSSDNTCRAAEAATGGSFRVTGGSEQETPPSQQKEKEHAQISLSLFHFIQNIAKKRKEVLKIAKMPKKCKKAEIGKQFIAKNAEKCKKK